MSTTKNESLLTLTNPKPLPLPARANDQERADLVRTGTTLVELLKHLWPYFMRERFLFFASIVIVFIVAATGRLTVTVFGYAIDHGILKNDIHVVQVAALIYLGLALLRCILTFAQNYLFSKMGNRVLFEIRENLVSHVQSLPLSYFDRNPSGRIVTRITTDVVSLGEFFTEGLVNIFASAVAMIAIVIAMLAISIQMTVFALLIAPPLSWVVARLSREILIVLRDSKAKIAALNAFVAESINGMKVLQLFGRTESFRTRFADRSQEYRDTQLKSVRLYALLWPTVGFFNATSVAVSLWVGGRLIFNQPAGVAGAISEGAMIAFILHVRAFMDPLHQILEKYQNLQNSLSGAERIFTLLDEVPEALNEQHETSRMNQERLKGAIEFCEMSFRYAPQLPNALKHVNLKILPGQSVALVGRTGSGKSTTIALLQRFYDPTEGCILLDGNPLTKLSRGDVRSRIGVVQQDTFMFRGTIADNIGLRDPRVTRGQIENAADRACLSEMLSRRNGGIDAVVEERGANLSFGERQLVAFARILAFDPDVLVLDEATANIDSHSESLIQEATRRVRAGRTSILIAHRISTIMDCDKIVLLSQGEILETGSHHELMNAGGAYRQLVDAQLNDL